MKNAFLLLGTLYALAHLQQGFAQNFPTCVSSASDSDGDGFGFENNQSCIVAGSVADVATSTVATIAGNFPICVSSATDPDGDGYGFENNRSCIVDGSSAFTSTATTTGGFALCTSSAADPDGDGFGFENNRTCIVEGSVVDTDTSIDSTNNGFPICASVDSDPDGDGFGFENNQSCIVDGSSAVDNVTPAGTTSDGFPICVSVDSDPDRDGFGFENNQSCIVDASMSTPATPATPATPEPPTTTPTTPTPVMLTASATDLRLQLCEGSEVTLGEAFGTTIRQTSGATDQEFPVSCVRQCSDGDISQALPDFPGWGFDSQFSAQCVFADVLGEEDSLGRVGVPYYVDDEQPERLVFEDVLAYSLDLDNPTWECTPQIREGIDQSFVTAGNSRFFQFASGTRIFDTRADVASNDFETGSSFTAFDIGTGSGFIGEAQTISITASPFEIPGFESIEGFIQLDPDNLTIYPDAFNRQLCQRTTAAPDANLPITFEQVNSLPDLALGRLLNRSMQCTAFESIVRVIGELGDRFLAFGSPVNLDGNGNVELLTRDVNVQFFGINDNGEDQYQLEEPVPNAASSQGLLYTVQDDSLFTNGGSGFASREVVFKQFNQSLIRMESSNSVNGQQRITLNQCIDL